jgi:2-polyprenyl-3-methyl-5-hydroxy-6-metoxy-1,4-benzoquinol methylase
MGLTPSDLSVKNQETEGLLSPWLRSRRLRQAAAFIEPGSAVLDIACGAGFLKQFLPANCRYFGMDRIQPPDTTRFEMFMCEDVMVPESLTALHSRLGLQVDVITMLAFVEHIKNPESILAALKVFLTNKGRIILTTPHPMGRNIHDGLSRIGLCSASAAAEHEQFLDRDRLEAIASQAGYFTLYYHRFLFGLNQVSVMIRNQ